MSKWLQQNKQVLIASQGLLNILVTEQTLLKLTLKNDFICFILIMNSLVKRILTLNTIKQLKFRLKMKKVIFIWYQIPEFDQSAIIIVEESFKNVHKMKNHNKRYSLPLKIVL